MKRNRNINEQEVITLYKTKTIQEIANLLNTYSAKISGILVKNGIKPERKVKRWKKVYDDFFDNIDNELKAYLLGFFIADGSLRQEYDKRSKTTSYRFAFSNSVDDEEIILLIHKTICPENKIIRYHNTKDSPNRKPQLMLQWTSNHMKDTLMEKYKIRPRKTYDNNYEFPINEIPRDLFHHFVRGYLDGDGTVNNLELRFVFNSKVFAEQFVSFFKKHFDEYKDIVEDFSYTLKKIQGKTVKYYRLRLPMGKGRKKLYETLLYKDATVFLMRKRNKLNEKRKR